jgi:hypothetical protein
VIFAFVAKRLRWLARLPGLVHVLDAALLIGTALFHRGRLEALELLEKSALKQSGVTIRPHRLGGVGFFFGVHELCHVHGNGLFDALVGCARREELVRSGDALEHHVFPSSGWISFWIKERPDVTHALELMRVATEYALKKV